jgi:hypothetical protein
MNSPVISKRDFFINTFHSVLDKLNTAIINGNDHYKTHGEIVIDMANFPELTHENVRQQLVIILKELGWESTFQTDAKEDLMILY